MSRASRTLSIGLSLRWSLMCVLLCARCRCPIPMHEAGRSIGPREARSAPAGAAVVAVSVESGLADARAEPPRDSLLARKDPWPGGVFVVVEQARVHRRDELAHRRKW